MGRSALDANTLKHFLVVVIEVDANTLEHFLFMVVEVRDENWEGWVLGKGADEGGEVLLQVQVVHGVTHLVMREGMVNSRET